MGFFFFFFCIVIFGNAFYILFGSLGFLADFLIFLSDPQILYKCICVCIYMSKFSLLRTHTNQYPVSCNMLFRNCISTDCNILCVYVVSLDIWVYMDTDMYPSVQLQGHGIYL